MAEIGGRSYWAREVLEIAGMTNRAVVQGHDADVSPARLLFAEKGDCSTGATGVNYYTILNEAAITPIEGGDLFAGPFVSNYEGVVEFSRDITEDRFPTVLLRTTHMIAGQDNIVSVRAVPTSGLLVGLNETASVGLSEFNSWVNLTRDVPNGGKIGLKIELAVALHSTEGARNGFMRLIQAGSNLGAAEAAVANKAYKIAFTNTAVSFIQWTKATKEALSAGFGAPYTVAQCDEALAALRSGLMVVANKGTHQVQLPDGVFYTFNNPARLDASINQWAKRRSDALQREGKYNRAHLCVRG